MIGKTLGERYEIIEKIGGGGMAIVYKAKCTLLNRYVAVKVLRSEFTTDMDLIEKFRRESQAAASLSHPNIVNLYDVGEDDGVYYIVMEFIDGNTLKYYIKENGAMELDTVLDYATQIALGLQHAHINHVIHRDIKPHNILITKDNRAKVTDFGIAIAATSSTLTNVGSVIGSVHYFSPEQARGGYTDEKSDLYSLGIVMYEMATGRLPFEAENPLSVALKQTQEEPIPPRKINENIPKGLENIILKLMQKEQSKRYQNARSLIEDLNKMKNNTSLNVLYKDNDEEEVDSPTQILPAIKDEDMKRTKKSNIKKNNKSKKPIIIGAIVAALLAALLFVFAIFYLGEFLSIEEVEVPGFEGLHIDEARALASGSNLELVIDTQHHNEISEDMVISQDPSEGMLVRSGYPIKLVVSLGNRMLPVPNILYRDESDVGILLEDGGFAKGQRRYANSDFPEGSVIEQSPLPSTSAPAGSAVDYVVSQGPAVVTLIMPNIVGSTIEEATNTLRQLGIGIGRIDRENSNVYEEGIVIRQSIVQLTEIEESAIVDFVVSKGRLNNQQEDPDEEDEETTAQVSQTTRSITIDLTAYNGNVDIEVKKVSTGQTVDSRKHNTQTSGSSVTIQITNDTGSGAEYYQVFVNGNKFGDQIRIVF